jgi:hypothetical protein
MQGLGIQGFCQKDLSQILMDLDVNLALDDHFIIEHALDEL